MQVLVVEDDRKLAYLLKKGLDENGHTTLVSFDGAEGLNIALGCHCDVFVLDVMLPGVDGFSIVRRLRSVGVTTPILLLTGKDAIQDVISGLDAGADDYLTKPFSFQILLARLRALARRRQVQPRMELRVSDLVLNPATHQVARADVPVSLTRTEFSLLEMLIRNAGRVITRDRAIEAVWGHDRDVENNTVDVFIRQLRSKVEPPGSRKLIHTIRGVGYTLRDEEIE